MLFSVFCKQKVNNCDIAFGSLSLAVGFQEGVIDLFSDLSRGMILKLFPIRIFSRKIPD